MDHKSPLCKGGKDSIENLALCCAACNRRKRRMTLDEYRAFVGVNAFHGEQVGADE